uniref:m7GpppX diphosphatase n=1 Tax=Romanomermis culicivorax TaxID=13658 RepID=A0A915IMH7_ROMCU
MEKSTHAEGDSQNGSGNEDKGLKSAVIILHKMAFDNEAISALFKKDCSIDVVDQNHIYTNFRITLPQLHNAIKGTFIYPATQAHIDKYREQTQILISETYDDYRNITLLHITSSPRFSTEWVENILDHKAEQESLIYEDPDSLNGFMLLPDLKWDRKTVDTFYATAICRRRGIKSLRDLSSSHLPMLKNIRQRACDAIREKFDLNANELRIFVHYQPTYYHFHVHFVHMNAEPVGAVAGQAHLLDDVIENIEMCDDYYQRKTLHFVIKVNDPLLSKIIKSDV